LNKIPALDPLHFWYLFQWNMRMGGQQIAPALDSLDGHPHVLPMLPAPRLSSFSSSPFFTPLFLPFRAVVPPSERKPRSSESFTRPSLYQSIVVKAFAQLEIISLLYTTAEICAALVNLLLASKLLFLVRDYCTSQPYRRCLCLVLQNHLSIA